MRALVMGLAAGFATVAVVARPDAQPAPDFAHAKELYDAANAELAAGRFDDAIRDYNGAYDITKDPILFWKLGTANEQAGKCDVALGAYARYVKEARPTPPYVELAKTRISACGGDWQKLLADDGAGAESANGSALGSGSELGSGGDAGSGNDAGSGVGSGTVGFGFGSGVAPPAHGGDAPWLMVGGALAFVTAGVVLAYSASSSEQDLRDLYVGLNGSSPTFDARTMARYNDLVDEGQRYQHLSWGAFGVAAGFGIAAALLFVREHNEHVAATPTGIALRW